MIYELMTGGGNGFTFAIILSFDAPRTVNKIFDHIYNHCYHNNNKCSSLIRNKTEAFSLVKNFLGKKNVILKDVKS